MGKRRVLILAVISIVLLIVPMAAFATFSGTKMCIDAGHGGSDPGAVAYGDNEKDFNLDIALRMRGLFQQDGATVVMTRTTDTYVSLQGRCDIANNNGAARFLCTHCNAGGGTGTETFAYASGGSAADLASHVQSELCSHMSTTSRGVKYNNFYVLVNTNMPAILGEVAFMDTQPDNDKLSSASYRQEAARAYLHGTQAHYGMTPHDPTVSEVIVDNTNAAFSVTGSWSTGTSSTDKYGSDYRYHSTQAVSEPATWAPNLASGTYAVYAWWPQGSNRCATAPYIVHYNGGTATVNVNQQANGGKWNLLGTWNFTSGNNVQLSCWQGTGYVVMADAVKFVQQ